MDAHQRPMQLKNNSAQSTSAFCDVKCRCEVIIYNTVGANMDAVNIPKDWTNSKKSSLKETIDFRSSTTNETVK